MLVKDELLIANFVFAKNESKEELVVDYLKIVINKCLADNRDRCTSNTLSTTNSSTIARFKEHFYTITLV